MGTNRIVCIALVHIFFAPEVQICHHIFTFTITAFALIRFEGIGNTIPRLCLSIPLTAPAHSSSTGQRRAGRRTVHRTGDRSAAHRARLDNAVLSPAAFDARLRYDPRPAAAAVSRSSINRRRRCQSGGGPAAAAVAVSALRRDASDLISN